MGTGLSFFTASRDRPESREIPWGKSRGLPCKKIDQFPVFPLAAVRQYLQSISFLNGLETKDWNIAFLVSVCSIGVQKKKTRTSLAYDTPAVEFLISILGMYNSVKKPKIGTPRSFGSFIGTAYCNPEKACCPPPGLANGASYLRVPQNS